MDFVIENVRVKYLYLFILLQEIFYSRIKLLLNKEEFKLLKDKMNSEAIYIADRIPVSNGDPTMDLILYLSILQTYQEKE